MGSPGDWSFDFGPTAYEDSSDDPDSDIDSGTTSRPTEHIPDNASRPEPTVARSWADTENGITATGSTVDMARSGTETTVG